MKKKNTDTIMYMHTYVYVDIRVSEVTCGIYTFIFILRDLL